MVYRRKDRPREGYRVWITLPGFGRVGPWQTGMRSERAAARMEAWLHQVALERPEVIAGIMRPKKEGGFTLRQAWVAALRGPDHLDVLLLGRSDPPLAAAVKLFRPLCTDPRARTGLDKLLALAPEGVRLSWLRESAERAGERPPRAISSLYAKAAETQKPNSIRRGLHRAVRELLVHEFGAEGARKRMEGLRVPGEDDAREVRLTGEEIRSLVRAAPTDRFRWMVVTAICTTADRAPLLRLLPRDFNDAAGELWIPDEKTDTRTRIVRLPEIARTVLRLAVAGLEPSERVFPWTKWQVRKFWDATRERAELPGVRFKDLRHLLPTFLAAAGVDRREIQAILGHATGSRMTDRYITPAGDVAALNRAAVEMGLVGSYLNVAEGA